MSYVIVVETFDRTQVLGPFETERDARNWEDRNLNAPAGSRATFVPLTDADDYLWNHLVFGN